MIDITDRIQRLVTLHRIDEGFLLILVPHTTAAITINENADPDVKHDLLRKLESLIPQRESYYQHAEGNSDSHVKASLVGNSVTVLIQRGKLVLGQWQGIQFCEFDGPRRRDLLVKIISLDRGDPD
jgi:secondary thiamine-phosphate synthase enzyme